MVRMGAKTVQSEDDIQGNARPLPGRYHVIVKHADDSFEKFDKVIVEFQVLAGTTPGQEDRCISEFFATTEKAMPRLQRLALCTGLLTPGEEEKDISFAEAEGRQLVIEVEENRYEKKDEDGNKKTVEGVRVGFLGMWSLTNKAVEDVPKNREAMKLLAEATGGSNPPRETVTAGATTATAASTSGDNASTSGDKWADL